MQQPKGYEKNRNCVFVISFNSKGKKLGRNSHSSDVNLETIWSLWCKLVCARRRTDQMRHPQRWLRTPKWFCFFGTLRLTWLVLLVCAFLGPRRPKPPRKPSSRERKPYITDQRKYVSLVHDRFAFGIFVYNMHRWECALLLAALHVRFPFGNCFMA